MGSYLSRYLATAKARQPAYARKRRSTWFRWFPRTTPARCTCLPLGRDGGQMVPHRRCRDCWLRLRRSLPAALRRCRRYPVRGSSAPQAWRRLPSGPPFRTFSGRGFSGRGNSLRIRSLENARHTQSLVDIRPAPPDSLGSLYTSPDPCAKETVLRAVSRCEKGRRGRDGPPRSEGPEPRPSAFRPVGRHGVINVYAPRPGPLRRSFCSQCNSLREEDTEPRPDQQPCLSLPSLPPTLW